MDRPERVMEMVSIRDIARQEDRFMSGHRLCAGCGAGTMARIVLRAVENKCIVTNATGCLEVASTIYPYTSWNVPWLHTAFENAGANAAGIEAALKAMQRKGKLPEEKIDVIAFGGDGGTFDIGIQALSGAIERGHDFLYICYDNNAYMNTGIQRSGATMYGAWTTTSPVGSVSIGKSEFPKDLVEIVAAHNIDYCATASIAYPGDLVDKVRKGLVVDGPAFLYVMAPCPRGWRHESDLAIEIAKLAVETRFAPVYEVVEGKYILNRKVPKPKPAEDYLKVQGRFRHLFRPQRNENAIQAIQEFVDWRWDRLLKKVEMSG
jgi:pyruvate ferredoxin oxidoreductase beta subunit